LVAPAARQVANSTACSMARFCAVSISASGSQTPPAALFSSTTAAGLPVGYAKARVMNSSLL